MKALIPLLIVSTSALAVTTVQFAHRAGAERKRADEAQAAVQKHEARIRELEQARSTQLMEAQRPPMPGPTSSVVAVRPVPPLPAPRAGGPQVAILSRAEAVSGGPVPFVVTQSSPAAQRYMRWQMKTSMRRQYDDVGAALGLAQEQANKLVDLLTDQQTRGMGEPRKVLTDMASMKQAAMDRKTRDNAEIAALIGEDRMPQWEEYQKTMFERSQVNMVREQMQNMGVPITEDQRAQLLNIVLEEAERNPRPMPAEATPPDEMFAQSMKWQDEHERNFLERAKSVLTSEQYERYRDYQEWQTEMRNNALRNLHSSTMGQGASVATFTSANEAAPSKQ